MNLFLILTGILAPILMKWNPEPQGVSAGNFYYLGYSGYIYTSTELETVKAWGRCLHDYYDGIKRGNTYRRMGFAVRCVRN